MAVVSDFYSTAALIFSIIGLAVAPLLPLFFKTYFRGLQFLQMSYLFALTMNISAFSYGLTTAKVDFNKNILTFCTSGDFVCNNGFALSFGVILVGVMVLTFLFVVFRRCCGKAIEFQPVFLTLKGFIKWIYLPLAFSSTFYVLNYIYLPIDMTTFLPPAIVLGVVALFPIFQLIAYKVIQKQNTNIWIKWLQFLGYCRLLSTAVLTACYIYYGKDIYLHLIMIALIIYPILHLWKGDFKYPVMERIVFILGEAAFLAIYYIFKYGTDYITQYDVDFFGLGGVLLIDLVLYLIRTTRLICYGGNEGTDKAVNPEARLEETAAKIEVSPKDANPKAASPKGVTKVSKYELDTGDSLKTSQNFIESIGKKSTVKKRK